MKSEIRTAVKNLEKETYAEPQSAEVPGLYPTLVGASVRRLTVAHFKILCHVQLEINVPQETDLGGETEDSP